MNNRPTAHANKTFMLAALVMFPLSILSLIALIAASIIAFTSGQIILGILCLPIMSFANKKTKRPTKHATTPSAPAKTSKQILTYAILAARAAFAIAAAQWLILGLAVALPLAMIPYTRYFSNKVKRIAAEALAAATAPAKSTLCTGKYGFRTHHQTTK